MLLTRRASLWLAAVIVPASGCASQEARPQFDLEKLPPHEGQLARLFDDTISPDALGLGVLPSANLQFNADFRDRVQAADVISAVRVTSVTERKSNELSTLHTLRFEPVRNFKGAFEEDLQELTITHHMEQPHSLLSTVQERARGRTMIGLWKRFRGKKRVDIHFHFVPDTEEIHKALQEAMAPENQKR
ncbi:MAG: hypothetical protein RMJ98_05655 [Myxococcales bacterium]|nr:hypothetical protein [Myxococcales bacterium]